MKNFIILLVSIFIITPVLAQPKTIHVFVALCDNKHQGIVPVPEHLGNGQDPQTNLYWGAMYGLKTYFKKKNNGWILLNTLKSPNPAILERILFKHATQDVYLLADAYDGSKIKQTIEDFLLAANGQHVEAIEQNHVSLSFGGGANLLAYIGHNGLMDFSVNMTYNRAAASKKRDAIILACFSKRYFQNEIKAASVNPVLWTTHFMAPEAYTLKAALDGWMIGENGKKIKERAAVAYNNYQKTGLKGARNLFRTGL